ncbi:MAG: hypothetical protein RR275_00560 [Lachnospiraceae bacterium]
MKKSQTLMMALILACSMSIPTFAAGGDPPVKGETVVGIQVYDYDPDALAKSVSFTVPLYVTLAVTQDQTMTPAGSKIIVPTANAYNIINTAKAGASSIAVSKLVVSKIAGSAWDLDPAATPTARNKLHMSLGSTDNLLNLEAKTFDTTTGFITAATSTSPVKANAQIAPNDGKLPLDIAATIKKDEVYAKSAAAAQINLAYTLQPLDKDGKFVVADSVSAYVGNIRTDAGYPAIP